MPDPDWWSALWPSPEDVLTRLGLAAGLERAIDLCCGDGLFTPALARLARHVDAIDIDADILERARRRTEACGVDSRCSFILADAYAIDRSTSPADLVLLANTFHGVPDKMRLSGAVGRALKPGGAFVVINWRRLAREETCVLGKPRGPATQIRMDQEEAAAAIEPAGFELSRVVDLPPYHYGSIFGRPS
ncbi:MAG TPA: class I SAM-dependent methyltransferase [Beijerinckiaceae bacterium]|nr:class I SAM-dependent methyltransferase [Beijerinckiaceae bacterium]